MKRNAAALSVLATCALALLAADPAAAAVGYSVRSAPAIGADPQIDVGNHTVYSAGTDESDPDASFLFLSAVDARSLRTTARVDLFDYSTADDAAPVITDIRDDPRTHAVWVEFDTGKAGTFIAQVDGTTMRVVHRYGLGGSYGGTMSIDAATHDAYVGGTPNQLYGSTLDYPFLESLDAATGATTTVRIPTPGDGFGDYSAVETAADSHNHGIYVTVDGSEFAYSNSLKLASTLTLPDEGTGASLPIVADGSTHTIYIAGSVLYQVAGATNRVVRTSPIASSTPFTVDPGIRTLYVERTVVSTTSLRRTGTLPHPASSVDGSTHTIYSPGFVTTRLGG